MSQASEVIAYRHLRYSKVGETQRYDFTVLIDAPYLLTKENANIAFVEGTARCRFRFEGLNETGEEMTGADTLQAVQLAIYGVDPTLRRYRKKYDFYYPDGAPYFDD